MLQKETTWYVKSHRVICVYSFILVLTHLLFFVLNLLYKCIHKIDDSRSVN